MRLGPVVFGLAAGSLAWGQVPLDRRPVAGAGWKLVFQHDEDGSSLSLADVQVSGSDCILAFGNLRRVGASPRPVVVRTNEYGSQWEMIHVDESPRSGFLLTRRLGWMVSDRGVWQTGDCGKTWRRVASVDGLRRVYFLDELRGFAVGESKQALRTVDGGQRWTRIQEGAELPGAPQRTAFTGVAFAGARFGFLMGWNQPRRPDEGTGPAWLDLERAAAQRVTPSLSLMLQTTDGGQTWKGMSSSVMGVATRMRIGTTGAGLVLMEFAQPFEWPSEVYRIDAARNQTERSLREKDRAYTDVALLEGGLGYAAGVEPVSALRGIPLPGRVRIARSEDLVQWREMAVDYRAMGTRVWLAAAPSGPVVAATDTGMILLLGAVR